MNFSGVLFSRADKMPDSLVKNKRRCAMALFLMYFLSVWPAYAEDVLPAVPSLPSLPSLPPLPSSSIAAPPAAEHPLMATEPSQTKKSFLYQKIQPNIVQIRILLQDKSSQVSSGSGFYATADGLIVTNYHVISSLALHPARHYAKYVSPDGKEGPVELLAIDVIHDLAIMRIPGTVNHDALELAADTTLTEGDRLYSLGNPLDIGFAVTEGIYNGLVKQQQLPNYFFSGVINSGMSGGPALNVKGQVIGVNVAARTDGQSLSFLIPIRFAKSLVEKARRASPIKTSQYAQVTEQLMTYQQELVHKWLSQPPRFYRYGHYQVPLPQDQIARCWGERKENFALPELMAETMSCRTESEVYTGEDIGEIEEEFGFMTMSYEFYNGSRLITPRFLQAYSKSFGKESLLVSTSRYFPARCHEGVIQQQGVVLKTVLCFRAHRKFPGLVTVSATVAPINESKSGIIGRFEAAGVSFKNGLELFGHYVKSFSWIS